MRVRSTGSVMTALTWTDEQTAVAVWLGGTFGPWLIIEMWVRWNRLLDRIRVAGAALALLVDADTLVDLLEMASADADNPGVRDDCSRAPVDSS